MDIQTHYRCLESMYQAAPVNRMYLPKMRVEEGRATIEIVVDERFHHSAGAVHGSVYFKMLDDAAFFAANSYEQEFFVLTTAFTTYLTRPVVAGKLIAKGEVVNRNKQQFIVESVVYDAEENEIGRGNGIFVRSRMPLVDALGYREGA